ncbi:alpha/beta fold hydrolase [Cellulomonas sp. DKR-3]|uniref:Alpha/beta fold hydrolase n=1 Tax=Cellulomonas fulva TaxID=2835530 RepID=A0ABS5TU71_9CELL|nr:alpha/beta fold hydrolase [Cellulomonas fulva]MBT0992678.1 alpha/beta fold hydrolase [Cellulomonas fulva]
MTLHVLREGDAPVPLVLLHAFPLDHRMWQPVAELLSGSWTVLAPDLPGSGGGTGLADPSLEAAADDVARELAAAGVARAVVAGLSMGGYVALALAERHPELVAALGLLDTKSTADTPEARDNRLRMARAAADGETLDPVRPMAGTLVGETTRSAQPHVGEQVAAWIEDQAPAGVAWSQRAMAARPDRTEVLAAFGRPVAVVVGDEDAVTPVAAAEHMASSAPAARLVVVPQAGHLSALEQPAAVAAALSELLQRSDTD